jgi:PQQ-dependent dehydrogenase (methanol/ethanol family)
MMAIGLAAAATSHAAGVTDQMIDTESSASGNVLSWGGTPQGQRFSPLNKINTANVSKLTPVWAFSFGGEKQRGQESQPLIYNGRMFVTGSYSRLYALDAATGKKLWKYEHRLPEGIMPCCDVVNRGAALYDDLVIFATLDAQLVALKQDTGEVVWKTKIDDYAAGYSATAAPIIANGLLLTGVSGGEFGVVGRVEARDPKTGKLVWTRPTVEGHMGYIWDKDGNKKENGISGTTNQTWPGDLWKTGGAATWLGGTYDPRPAWPTSAPATRPWNSHLRKGDNLFSCSTVAIDVKTGKIVWHYQGTPNDSWDFDGANEFITFDQDGKRLGAKADRNGFFYVLDATTGKLQNAFPFVKKITWASGVDLKTGRPNFVPENRPGDPTGRRQEGQRGVRGAGLPGRQEPDADGLQPADPPVLRAGQRVGHGDLERAGGLQEGRGLPGRGLHHQAAERRLHRRAARGGSQDRQDRLGSQGQRPAVGWRADHRRQPGVLGHARGLPEGRRRQDRQGGLAVPDRLRRRGASGHLAAERRAVRGRGFRLGRCRAAVGWRGGQAGQLPRAGRHDVGVQAAQELITF